MSTNTTTDDLIPIPIEQRNLMASTTAEETLKIIIALLTIAVIYGLVEAVRYWQRHEESLFKQPPPNEDCPICFLTLPSLRTGRKYQTCCGKIICSGCIHAVNKMDDDGKCPFCRVPSPTSDEEMIERAKKRVEMDDAEAIYNLGCDYDEGLCGLPQARAIS